MSHKKNQCKVTIVMGSQSDYSTMKYCSEVLKVLKVKHETFISFNIKYLPTNIYLFL